MVKSNNKGFSLVELIIAAAVFAILVYPITNALIAATKTTSTSTKKQYAVEKAEEIMENFKTADLGDKVALPDDNGTKTYTFNKGTSTKESISLPNSNSVYMATNLKEDKVMMGFSIAFIIIVLIVLYSLARTAGESDRILENIREQSLLGREESSGGNS